MQLNLETPASRAPLVLSATLTRISVGFRTFQSTYNSYNEKIDTTFKDKMYLCSLLLQLKGIL